ncbi:zinc-ribbon domain-containing protein [Microbispora bryophytorum]|uniref:zinc-ribbon domain-containing protein n=1 Tax=Microbispora bryophytorum TaxID=1460882 RepID=UPI0033F8FF5F
MSTDSGDSEGPKPEPRQKLSALLAGQAIEVIGHPNLSPADLPPKSNRKVRWQRSVCTHTWITAVSNRTAGRGCPMCAREKRAASRAMAPSERSLLALRPNLASEFIKNIDRPDFAPAELRLGSQQRCVWRCRDCGHIWEASVANRVNGRGCPDCANRSRSGLRYQVRRSQTTAAAAWPWLPSEFVANLTLPGRGLDSLSANSTCRCLWRCSICSHEWEATIVNRGSKRSGCPICANERVADARRRPQSGASLAELRPDLSSQFLENLSVPGRGPERLKAGSNDICRWRCSRGHEWQTTVAARAAGSGCSRCSSMGKSRFEYEVAELVSAATELTVEVDVLAPVLAGRRARVDLYISSINLWIDLDPPRWHKDLSRDKRKSEKLAHLDYVRVRSEHLPSMPGEIVVVSGEDPWCWALTLAPTLQRRGAYWSAIGSKMRGEALSRAMVRWAQLTGEKPSPSALDVAPHLQSEFSSNETRPSVGLYWLPPTARDICSWVCQACGHQWRSSVLSRAFQRSGCPVCARTRLAVLARENAKAPIGGSLADLFAEVAMEFLKCIDDPEFTSELLRPASNKRCEWRCRYCSHQWITSPAQRTRGSGCPECAREVIRRSRTFATTDSSLYRLRPKIAAEFVECVDEPGRTASDLLPQSNKRCRWRCDVCSHEWVTTVASRAAGAGCPACGRIKQGHSRAMARPGQSLLDLFPEVAAEFVRNESRPHVDPSRIRRASHDRVLWRCNFCSNEWVATVKNRTRGGTGCPKCAR